MRFRPRAGRLARGGLLLAALWFVPAIASAQVDQYAGRPIADVRLTIHGQPATDVELRHALETQVGRPLVMAQVRESIVRLMAFGRFEDVRVDASPGPAGVTLVYDLVPVHVVRAVEFHGRLGLSASLLRAQVVDRYGASPPLGRTDDVVSSLVDLYREHGYRNAKVTAKPQLDRHAESATLAFDIDAGAQVRISRIAVDGDAQIDRQELLRRLDVKEGGPYNGVAVRARAAAYAESLRSRGFYQALIEPTPRYSADGSSADLGVTAIRGSLVTVEIRGENLSRKKREALVPVARDKSVDEDLLEDWSGNLTRDLQAQGYKDAAAPWHREEKGGALRLVFDVVRGRLSRVAGVRVAGSQAIAEADVLKLLGLQAGQLLTQAALDAGRGRLEDRYKREGFEDARVQVAQQVQATTATEVQVEVTVQVGEGAQTRINQVRFAGNAHVPDTELARLVTPAPGRPFYAPEVENAKDPITLEYLNRGYQGVSVAVETPPAANHSRDVRFVIREGTQIFVDHILVVGNTRTKADTIREALQLKPGDPLSLEKLEQSRERLSALGLFRRVQVSDVRHGSENQRDLVVTVQEAAATTLAWGGGLEGGKRLRVDENGNTVESIEFAPRGLIEIGRRNLWGKNRSINFTGSIAVRPESGGLFGTGLREYRALGTYREPRVLNGAVDLLVSGGLEQAVRPAYSFNRRSIRAELVRRLSNTLTLYGRYSLERTRVFNEPITEEDQTRLGRILPRARLSKVSSSIVSDTRDDAADPSRGALLSADGEVAPQFLGSQFGVARTLVQGFVYHRVPAVRRIVFAGGLRMGLATGFGTGPLLDIQGDEILGPDGQPIIVAVTQPPLSERFFAGGNTTVRGVAEDSLGTPDTLTAAGFATGGSALFIANAELRFSIWKSLSAVAFADVGNVFARVSEFRLSALQPAVGVGVRYNSPVGPIRVDIGFNLKRRTLGGTREGFTSFYIGIGQAF
jgi:outer membrane protein insertion porin family